MNDYAALTAVLFAFNLFFTIAAAWFSFGANEQLYTLKRHLLDSKNKDTTS